MAREGYATLEEAAEFMACSVLTVRRRISDGSLPGYKLGPRAVRVRWVDVEALFEPIPVA